MARLYMDLLFRYTVATIIRCYVIVAKFKLSNSINVIKVKIVIEYRRPELSISNYYQYSCQMDYLVLCIENDVDCLLREIYPKLDTTTSILPQTKNTPSTRCATFACTSSFIVHFRAILISRKHRGLPIPNHESRQREERETKKRGSFVHHNVHHKGNVGKSFGYRDNCKCWDGCRCWLGGKSLCWRMRGCRVGLIVTAGVGVDNEYKLGQGANGWESLSAGGGEFWGEGWFWTASQVMTYESAWNGDTDGKQRQSSFVLTSRSLNANTACIKVDRETSRTIAWQSHNKKSTKTIGLSRDQQDRRILRRQKKSLAKSLCCKL
jgi:hypothetical protein